MSTRILVTGGGGFLGTYLVGSLIEHGYMVRVLDRRSCELGNVEMLNADVADYDAVEKAVSGVDYIIHLAATADIDSSRANPRETLITNILGTVNLLEAVRLTNPKLKKFVFASTVYVTSDEGSFYAISKKACEKVIREYSEQYGIHHLIVRYGSLYGPGADSNNRIHKLVKEALEKGTLTHHGSGEEVREFIHAFDAAEQTFRFLEDKAATDQTVMLVGSQRLTMSTLLAMINEIMGNEKKIRISGEKHGEHYAVTPYHYSRDVCTRVTLSNHIDLGEGLLKFIKWYEQHEDGKG